MAPKKLRPISSLSLVLALAACGGGGGGSSPTPPAPPPTFAISGTVSGLQGPDLALRFNSVDLVLHANGAFTGPVFAGGTAYSVVVQDQPRTPWQTCTVTNGSGTLNAAVNNVAIACVTNNYRVGGTVTGLAGARFALQLNGGAAVPVAQDGTFTLPGDVASGTNYTVAVQSQPIGPGQDCVVANGVGQVAGADVAVTVTCTTQAFSHVVLNLDAQDMAYNAAAGELYVSVPTTATTGPAILVIDPRTGDTLRTVVTPQIATPLAISDDAQFMYAGMGESGSIRRFALPALTTSLDFTIGVDNTGHVLVPADIRVAPGNAHTVAVTRAYTQLAPAEFGLAVYDDGVARANTLGNALPLLSESPDGALWSADGTKIYSFESVTSSFCLYESAVSASGVTLTSCIPRGQERSYGAGVPSEYYGGIYRNAQTSGGRVYLSTGAIYDPATRTQSGAFRTRGQGLALDTARNKAHFASGEFATPLTFQSFNLTRMIPVAEQSVPGVVGDVRKLVRWGAYGLAAITSTDRLVLVSGTFVSDAAGATPLPVGPLVESTGNVGAHQYRIYGLPARDVVWDATRERLYAAVTGEHPTFGNSIASINVATNQVVGGAAAGSEPTWISLSDDATKLYVTHFASSSVVRVNVQTMLLEATFLLNRPDQGPGFALAAEARPGDASSFAFAEHYPATGAIWINMISGLQLRPLSLGEQVSTLAFVDANTLFGNNTWSSGLDLLEIGVVPTGLQLVRNDQNLFNGAPRMTFAGGLLYGDGGFSIDPVTRNIAHTYNSGICSSVQAFRAYPARDRGFMACQDSGSEPYLVAFRLSDEALLAAINLPTELGEPISLASMGTNGVALTTVTGKTVIVQGPDL